MRFLVDAQLPPALARWLATTGHEADHVGDRGMQGVADEVIWNLALREQRTLASACNRFFYPREVSK